MKKVDSLNFLPIRFPPAVTVSRTNGRMGVSEKLVHIRWMNGQILARKYDRLAFRTVFSNFYEDNYFTFLILELARSVMHISEKLYLRRYRDNSIMTSGFSERNILDHIKIHLLIWNEIIKNKNNFLLEKKNFLLMLVNNQCGAELELCRLFVEGNGISDSKIVLLLQDMLSAYLKILNELRTKGVNWDYTLCMGVLKNFYLFKCFRFLNLNDEDMNIGIRGIIEIQKEFYENQLKELPFRNKQCKVGIYGTGKHTEGLLAIYEKLFGAIACDLVFIDSKRDNETYKGKSLINYEKVDRSFDLVVISSFIHGEEMIANVRGACADVPIYTFYGDMRRDVFSEYEAFLEYC